MDFVISYLNSIADTALLEKLGFELEASPQLDGVQVVVNNVRPSYLQWFAVVFMSTALVFTCVVEGYGQRHPQYWIWAIGLVSSWGHNVDNILRPGTYFTPSWIVTPTFAFPMDNGFVFWLTVMMLGIMSLHTSHKLPVFLHGAGTSLGIMHYMPQSPTRFTPFAHASILFEVIMGLIVGFRLLAGQHPSRGFVHVRNPQSLNAPLDNLSQVYRTVSLDDRSVSASLEMPVRDGLRQRSRSPHVAS